MGLISYIKQAANSIYAGRSLGYLDRYTGSVVTPFLWDMNAREAYRNKIVFAVINVIVNKLVEPPMLISKVRNRGEYDKYNQQLRSGKMMSNEMTRYHRVKALEEVQQHPLRRLLEEEPNNYQSGRELRATFWFNYKLFGDGFIWAERTGNDARGGSKPIALHVLPSDKVKVRYSSDWKSPILGYVYNIGGLEIPLEKDDVLHMSKWNPMSPYDGMRIDARSGYSAIQAARKSIAKNEANMEAQGAAFRNGGTGTIIGLKGQATREFQKMSNEQLKTAKRQMVAEMSGVHNNRGIFLFNEDLTVQKLGDTLAELKLMEYENGDWRDICAVFNISPTLLGDTSAATENNVQAGYKSLVTNVCIPDIVMFDEKLKQKAAIWYKDQGVVPMTDVTAYNELAPDLKLMKEIFADLPFITWNEKRMLFNFDEDVDNDFMKYYWVNSGMMPAQQAAAEQDTSFNDIDPTGDYE